VIRLGFRELSSRRTATILSAAALLTATMSFLVLAGTAKITRATLSRDIGRAWNTPYDLLVRPPDSRSALERTNGLIRPNYVSGLLGGITLKQLEDVRSIPGVDVAAPIAMVGFVEWPSAYLQSLSARGPGATTVYRVTTSATGDAGLSRYPVEQRYVVIAKRGHLNADPSGGVLQLVGGGMVDCSYPVNCFARRVCGFGAGCEVGHYPSVRDARYYLPLLQPIVIAGIDPAAEAKIVGLDRCVTTGRYLSDGDHPVPSGKGEDPPFERIPVLVSTHAFIDQTLTIRIERATNGSSLAQGTSPEDLRSWERVETRTRTVASLYVNYLPSIHDYLDPWPIWSAGDVTYETHPPVAGSRPSSAGGSGPSGLLRAEQLSPQLGIYQRSNTSSEVGVVDQLLVPPEAQDSWFRPVVEHQDEYPPTPGTPYRFKLWNAVGRYDPTCLPSFNPLAGGGLETYSAPMVVLPDGRDLGPSRSMAGYVNSPPLLLTTLEGAGWLANPARYAGQPGNAFISVIRVRVSQTRTPSTASEARLEVVAGWIHDATGLQVDVVKGSSTRSVRVDLPAGRFGRPDLAVTEPWWEKGAAIRFTTAVRAQDLTLFALVLVGAVILVGESAFVSVRRRQSEFGLLRAIGWPVIRISWLVEVEMVLLGCAVGLASLVAGLGLRLLVLHTLPIGLAPLSLALAVAVAGLAGVIPALAAARGSAMSVLRGRARIRRSRPPWSAAVLGLRELAGIRRAESLLGIGAVALGAGLFGGVLLATRAFRDRLDVTTLGTFLGGQVRPFHVVIAVLAVVFGAIAAGQIVTLGYVERQREFAVLRAFGWPRAKVLVLLAAQGIAIGVCGGLLGGLVVWIGGVAAGESGSQALGGAVAGALVAVFATAMAIGGPLLLAYRSSPADALREE
jgi:putative ABC transport system permease protein